MNSNAPIQTLISDAAELVEATIDLEKQAALVPALQKRADDADAKLAKLAKADADFKVIVREGATKVAGILETSGFKINKEAFVEKVVNNPAELFTVIEKVAAEASVPSLGGAGGQEAESQDMDPLERWVQE